MGLTIKDITFSPSMLVELIKLINDGKISGKQAKEVFADMIGTMVLVLMGCGTVVSLNCGVDTASVIGTAMAFA